MVQWREWSVLHVLLFMSFLVSGLIVNMIQLVMWIVLVMIMKDRRLFRRCNYYCIYVIYGQLLFLADWWSGSSLTVYYDDPGLEASVGRENALCIMNHHYELDWLYGWMMGDRSGILGNCRVYIKKAIQFVPIIGWAWCFSDTLFLARDWSHDQGVLETVLEDLQDYPSPVWILLFPEGTRYTREKYLVSKQFAESRGLPVLKHHLVPRTKGFTYTLSRLDKNKISCIYDVTLGCNTSVSPTLTNVLLGRRTEAHMFIRKFDIKTIPEDEAGAAKWLSELYVEKDDILDKFHQTGSFDVSQPGVSRPARPWTLVLSVSLNISMMILIINTLLNTGLLGLIIAAVVMILSSLGIKYFVELTQISKASSYGDKKKD